MTDRVQRLHVTLDKEYRTDDVQAIVNAILMVKGVASVELAELAIWRKNLRGASGTIAKHG